jgi:Prealbumin-like fold domain
VKPSADYQFPPVKFVSIVKDQELVISVINILKPGRIQIVKVNQADQPLVGACFKVTPGNIANKCTDGSGTVVFDGLKPGVYTVTETKAPYGYLLAPAVTNIVVKPGLTTPIKIVDKKAPPPPDAGSVKIIKFFCPLGKAGELSTVYDSSDPGQKSLALTVNCKKGDQTFILTSKSGQGDPIQFSTGADGEAHLTLPAGTYILTEVGTNVSVEVVVYVGQQTTVVVLNYVPPPKPAPVSIVVRKYTCDPGFQGQFYLDFINACGSFESLTNGVKVRISGAATAARVTGDSGSRGLTQFSQLPAGNYTLKEDTPIGQTAYVWCGVKLESSEFGAVGNVINFPLSSGQTMYCAYFNVPDEVTETTGTIVVHKFSCEIPQVKRPPDFDWFAECSPQTTGVKFALSLQQGETFVPKSTGLTDVNGKDWCHAESDSVNAQGNVVVKAGNRSNVWIFNCIPAVKAPNTGAGTTAGLIAAPEISGLSGGGIALLAAWPIAGFAGLRIRRRMLHKAA